MTLIERIEAATGPDRALDRDIMRVRGEFVLEKRGKDRKEWWYRAEGNAYPQRYSNDDFGHGYPASFPRYTASIDSALTLVPKGYDWSLDNFDGVNGQPAAWLCNDGPFYNGTGASPALALCAAALRAREASHEN